MRQIWPFAKAINNWKLEKPVVQTKNTFSLIFKRKGLDLVVCYLSHNRFSLISAYIYYIYYAEIGRT